MKKGFTKIAAALFAAGMSLNLYAANVTVALDADPESLDVYEQLSGGSCSLPTCPMIRWFA